MTKKNVVVIGAGPAGLTAAYELLKIGNYNVTVLEETNEIGGISKTVNYKGNRMDMGGHRFFSKVEEVNRWWNEMLPLTGAKPKDDILLDRDSNTVAGGPNPEETDIVMLLRHRVSRILFLGKFFDYPVSLKFQTLKNMGIFNTISVGFSYLFSLIHKLPDTNLENFYINRFGRKLYSMFFENYTENLWGRHPREIDASWGSQRVKGLSISAVLKDICFKLFKINNKNVETSLIEEFKYPKLGPGQLWEITANKIEELGGTVLKNSKVINIHKTDNNKIDYLTYSSNGTETNISCDIVISSMPLKDLVLGMNNVPKNITDIAAGLPYRDYMTVGVLVKKLNLKNETNIKTVNNIIPDCWVYVQERSVKMGRFQVYNNWSPYMVKDYKDTIWLGLEYFVQENDNMWTMKDEDFSELAISELLSLKLIDRKEDVLDSHVERVKKAYPAYFDTYNEIDSLREYLNGIDNLYCVGRNGQHRYNNIDHSMCTSFEAVHNIDNGITDKSNIWAVNTEKDYHESK